MKKPFKLKTKAMLPNREAVNALTKGGPAAMSMGNYAKLTPSGAGAMMQNYNNITAMGLPKRK